MTRPSVPAFAARPVVSVAVVVGLVLTALSGRYGFHRDELYFMVAGRQLSWGYVDQPPLTPLAGAGLDLVFGDTVMGLRVLSTVSCAITIIVVALIAREFGSDRRGQLLAAVCAAVSGFVLGVGHLVSTATYDLLAWMLIGLFAVKLLRTGDGRWWLALGLTAGIALENKYLVVLPVGALLVALLIVGPRDVLRSWWLLAGVALAGLARAAERDVAVPARLAAAHCRGRHQRGRRHREPDHVHPAADSATVAVPGADLGGRLPAAVADCRGPGPSRWRIRCCASSYWPSAGSRTTPCRCCSSWWRPGASRRCRWIDRHRPLLRSSGSCSPL